MSNLWDRPGKDDGGNSVEKCLYKIGSQAYNILLPVTTSRDSENELSGQRIAIKPSIVKNDTKPTTSNCKRVTYEDERSPRNENVTLLPDEPKPPPRTKRLWDKISSKLNSPTYNGADDDLWDTEYSIRSYFNDYNYQERHESRWCRPSYIPITLILVLIFLVVLLPLLDQSDTRTQYLLNEQLAQCSNKCRLELVESIPEGLHYPGGCVTLTSTFDAWKNLINISQSTIEIASFYWTLRKTDIFPDPSSYQVCSVNVIESSAGDEIYNDLLDAGLKRNIKVKIAQNQPSEFQPNLDTEYLTQLKAAEVKSLNFSSLMGGGVLHTKFWIIDRKHVYVGSANMDWRSLTQVKELGAVMYDCPCVAQDLAKIFSVYWDLGGKKEVPDHWPKGYSTIFNMDNPFNITINGDRSLMYISSSPPPFSTSGRTNDIDAILHTISSAKRFVYIAVMDYFPLNLYTSNLEFWPVIDNELRRAVVDRGVHVRLLISNWKHSRAMELNFLRSLIALNKFNSRAMIEVKLFTVPANSTQSQIPFARVNHNKYMVTDNCALIGTSNWSGDYFINTAGVSLVFPSDSNLYMNDKVKLHLGLVFQRDWDSNFSTTLEL